MFWPKPVTQHCSIRNGKNSDGHAGKRSIVFKETQRRSFSSFPASGCCSTWVQCLWGLQAFCHLEDKPATLRTLRMTRQGGRESLDPQHHRTAEWISWLWAHPDLPWGCFYKTKKNSLSFAFGFSVTCIQKHSWKYQNKTWQLNRKQLSLWVKRL